MPSYVLDVFVNKGTTVGSFVDYSNMGAPFVAPNNPGGRVWWSQANANAAWIPVAPKNGPPNNEGNPRYASPLIKNGDAVTIQLVDPNNADPVNKVVTVQFAVVFGRTRGQDGKHRAPKASPFQTSATATGVDRTTFTGTVFANGSQFLPFTLPLVTYPQSSGGPKENATFSCYVGAVVTFGDSSQRQYGLDPEMEVDDYGGGFPD